MATVIGNNTTTITGGTFTSGSGVIWAAWQDQWVRWGSTATTVDLSFNQMSLSWTNWNTVWEGTAEQAHLRHVASETTKACAAARAHAFTLFHGQPYTVEVYLQTQAQALKDFTEDEMRTVADGFQRGLEEAREDRRQQQEREELAAAAVRKAELLLLSLLDHEQKQEWLEHRRVTVATSDRVWRLFPKWAGGAVLMDGEVRRATLCVHPRDRVPDVDTIVALLMALRSGDEEHLLQIAILHAGAFSADEMEIRRRIARPDPYVVAA